MKTIDDRLKADEAVHNIEFLSDALHIIAYAVESGQCFDRHQTLANAIFGIESAIQQNARFLENYI